MFCGNHQENPRRSFRLPSPLFPVAECGDAYSDERSEFVLREPIVLTKFPHFRLRKLKDARGLHGAFHDKEVSVWAARFFRPPANLLAPSFHGDSLLRNESSYPGYGVGRREPPPNSFGRPVVLSRSTESK